MLAHEPAPTDQDRPAGPALCELDGLRRVLAVVRERRGIDFDGYRTGTLLRRVQNRMIAAGVRSVPAYLELLRTDPSEPDALLERLTIKVSRFFRDAGAFETLRRALAVGPSARSGVVPRAWSAGCGHGEEAYSLAMLLAEEGARACPAQVLATDVDPAALSAALRGRYPASALAELPAELAARWLEPVPGGRGEDRAYQVRTELRARVEFRRHDLAGGAAVPVPSSALCPEEAGSARRRGEGEARAIDTRGFDLVACRNVLIYFGPALQARAQRLLLESVVPGGLLWLGEAEWPLREIAAQLEVVDRRARVFRRRDPEPAGGAG